MTVLASYTELRACFATTLDRAGDGFEEWPSEELEAGGFTGGFTGVAAPIAAFPIDVSVDGSANGSEAYHAYLSQRTDDAASQSFTIVRTSGKSGTWTIALTSFGATSVGLGSTTAPVSVDQLTKLLKHVYLYVQRISDDAIQFLDLTRESLS